MRFKYHFKTMCQCFISLTNCHTLLKNAPLDAVVLWVLVVISGGEKWRWFFCGWFGCLKRFSSLHIFYLKEYSFIYIERNTAWIIKSSIRQCIGQTPPIKKRRNNMLSNGGKQIRHTLTRK